MKICFLIRALDSGGAQTQVGVLACALGQAGHEVEILTYYPGGVVADELAHTNVSIHCLHKSGRWDIIRFMWRLIARLRAKRPDCLYSFLTVSNILSVLVRPFVRNMPVIWGVRASKMKPGQYGFWERLPAHVELLLSTYAPVIVCNSEQALRDCRARGMGMTDKKLHWIANGIDTGTFVPHRVAGQRLRGTWELPRDAFIVGVSARYDPMKGFDVLLAVVRRMRKHSPGIWFVLAGRGTERFGEDGVLGLGERTSMRDFYCAVDVLCLPSVFGESFPNAIAEAMACGVPVVATDVGATSEIVADTGWIVPAGDECALFAALKEASNCSREALRKKGKQARERIEKQYTVDRLVCRTLELIAMVKHR
ncbi:MAG: glycosyltransferase [Rhodospirillales bacterium]|nr:glycosyltransferase [Rhodospirillales bacterium]